MNATAENLLTQAEETIRTQGYAGLSFRTLAQQVGIKSASVHYHFPTKAHLGVAVANRYRERFGDALAQIDARLSAPAERLQAYVDIYGGELRAGNNRLSICMMLAAEMNSLPEAIGASVTAFYRMNLDWLTALLTELDEERPEVTAKQLLALLQGAVLGTKTLASIDYFEAAAEAVSRLISAGRTD